MEMYRNMYRSSCVVGPIVFSYLVTIGWTKDLIIPIPFLRVCLAIIWIFRHFPLLLKCVYNDLAFLVPSIKDAFQHLYSSILNAELGRAFIVDKIITKKSPLNLIPMDMIIPKPVAMYYELIADLIFVERSRGRGMNALSNKGME